MGNRCHRRLKASRVATHFPSLRENLGMSSNAFMFIEDVQLAVMPIGGRPHRASGFAVDIRGRCEHADHATVILNSLAEFDQHSDTALLSDVVAGIARQFAWYGRSVHEIVWNEKNGGTFRLHSFTSRRLFHTLGRYVQIIPKADQDLWGKSYVIVPEIDIWEVAMPKVLGGYRGYRAILWWLARFRHLGPSFLQDELSQQTWPAHYDFQRYVRETKFFEAKITARWGWNQRDFSQSNWTEFYMFYRILRFKWAQAVVREHIVNELNRLFRRLRVEAEIVVKGLPTASEIIAIRKRMSKGEISFQEASDACSV